MPLSSCLHLGLDPKCSLNGEAGLVESLLFHMDREQKELNIIPVMYVPRSVSQYTSVAKKVFLAAWRRVAPVIDIANGRKM